MASQHVVRTYTDADDVDHEMFEAQFTSRYPFSFKRWYTCHICGLDYRIDEVMLQGGIAFCIPLEDYKEMNERRQGGAI